MYPTKADLIRNPSLAAPPYRVSDPDEDGWKADARAELKALKQLTEDVDEAAALARDCDTLCPEAKTLLDLAWWFTEKALRDAHGHCSAGCPPGALCDTCRQFDKLKQHASSIKGRL
jgi:hypothetical protein